MRVLLALCVMAGVAAASPPCPFDELLHRADVVFVGSLVKRTTNSGTIAFTADKVLRGKLPAPIAFDFDPERDLPAGVTTYVVISQGPVAKRPMQAALGQGIEGQAGYHGWIVFPVQQGEVVGTFLWDKTIAKVKLADIAKIVARAPYKP